MFPYALALGIVCTVLGLLALSAFGLWINLRGGKAKVPMPAAPVPMPARGRPRLTLIQGGKAQKQA